MFKNLAINFALRMADRLNRQAAAMREASVWWSDLSESIEDGVEMQAIRDRRIADTNRATKS